MAITIDLLTRSYQPYKYVMTYKFSQNHLELLFNKIHQRCGWNNNPDVLQFKYALRTMLIRNSIEPSSTGNCTKFEESLCEPNIFLDLSSRKKSRAAITEFPPDDETLEMQQLLADMHESSPNELMDNILYYISGFIVRKLLPIVKCRKCRQELLLDPLDPQAMKMKEFPVYTKFTRSLQKGGLILPSSAVMKVVKATEILFKRQVICSDLGITMEKNVDLKIETAVVEQFGSGIFSQTDGHFYDHHIAQESDHLTSLLRSIVQKYLNLCLKTYGKRYTEMITHKNLPSSRHELTKTILFLNQ